MTSYDARRVSHFPKLSGQAMTLAASWNANPRVISNKTSRVQPTHRANKMGRGSSRPYSSRHADDVYQTPSILRNASSPLSCQSLTLLGKWLQCAPKDRLCSILKKLCEEQAI